MFLGWNWSSTVFSHIAPILGSIFGTVWADTVFEFRGEEVLILLGGLSVRLHLVQEVNLVWFGGWRNYKMEELILSGKLDVCPSTCLRDSSCVLAISNLLTRDGSSGGGEFYMAFYGPDNRTTFLVRLEFLSSWGLYLDIFGVLGERQSLLFVNNIWLSFLPHTADILLLLFCFFPHPSLFFFMHHLIQPTILRLTG